MKINKILSMALVASIVSINMVGCTGGKDSNNNNESKSNNTQAGQDVLEQIPADQEQNAIGLTPEDVENFKKGK